MAQQEHRDALPEGTVLRGRYRIEGILGAGGYAITYIANHTGLDQKVAIKEYLPDQFAVREADHATVRPRVDAADEYEHGLKRFAEEARTLAKFKHPGIVPVTDIFEENDTAYMVMEYVEGESLQQRLAREGTLDEPAFRVIFEPLLEALDEVHDHGILHRDIKPDNIYLRADGSPVLLDFGNSREDIGPKAQSLTVALTPGYAPSEQYSSRGKQGPWTDIYSLGATMYAAVTGMRPPEAPDRALDDEYVRAGETGKDIETRFSAALLETIDQALAVRPGDRPQRIEELQDLFAGRGSGPRTILPASVETRSDASAKSSPAKRQGPARAAPAGPRWRRLAIAASVLIMLAAGGAFAWMKHQQAEAARMATEAQKASLLAAERARAEAARRREAARFERAADLAEERAVEAARREAWLREQREKDEQRRKSEERRQGPRNKPPRCRDVGGYEAYMKRTGKVCML